MPRKKIKGKIVSDKMQKTVVVEVESTKRHPLYSKIIKRTRRFKARNETEAKLGDMVFIEECKPYSKQVSWKVVEVVE